MGFGKTFIMACIIALLLNDGAELSTPWQAESDPLPRKVRMYFAFVIYWQIFQMASGYLEVDFRVGNGLRRLLRENKNQQTLHFIYRASEVGTAICNIAILYMLMLAPWRCLGYKLLDDCVATFPWVSNWYCTQEVHQGYTLGPFKDIT